MTKFYIQMLVGMALIAALLVWGPAAKAQMRCGEYSKIAAALLQHYKEVPVSMGLANNGSIVQVFSSKEGSWTIIGTTPQGVACLLTHGEAWQALDKPSPTNYQPVSSHGPDFKDKRGVVGSKRVVGVVCLQQGIDAFHVATLEGPQVIEEVLDRLFRIGACFHNSRGYRVTLKALYKSYEDYEGAGLEIWELESDENSVSSYTWNYMGKQ